MRPAVHACLATALLAALTGASPGRDLPAVPRALRSASPRAPAAPSAPRATAAPAAAPSAGRAAAQAPGRDPAQPLPPAPCASGSLPDGDGCVPFDTAALDQGEALESQRNRHHDRQGQLREYEQIPRQPGRPEAYEAYRYPIPTADGERLAVSGFDLDRPDAEQRRGAGLRAVGHGGVDLAAARGTEVRALALDHQEGDAEVLHVGPLFGRSVVTLHTVREAGRLRSYVMILGHLDATAPGLARGARAPSGALLGNVGDSGSEGVVHLHLELRRVRDGLDPSTLAAGQLASHERTIAVDPRNLLPLR